jgi:hypothetical protein
MRNVVRIIICLSFFFFAGIQMSAQTAQAERFKTFWPPVVNQFYPELELCNLSGKKVKLSSFAGKVILLEPIGMSCPACQAFVGADKKGGMNGVVPQSGLSSIDALLAAQGVSPSDPRLVRVQLLLYGPTLNAPSLAEAQAWAKHFDFGKRDNEALLIGDQRYINQHSFNMIPGFQLIDRNFVLRCDACGHNPKSNMYTQLIPMVAKLF